jgi:hypothetical protein
MSPKNSSSDTLTATSSGSDVAVVICNGPSLASVPNEWLDKYPTFGANRIFLKYSPDVLTILDLKMVHNSKLQEEAREGAKGSKEVFLSEVAAERMGVPDNATVLKWFNMTDGEGNLTASFSANPPESVLVSGGTVTYGMFQLAYWKGFRKILTVGLNHTFRDPRGDHFSSDYNREVSIPYDRENVVDGEVASEPGKWFWSEEAFVAKTDFFYGVAKELFEREGGWIKNCTPDTKCDVFDVEDWRDY